MFKYVLAFILSHLFGIYLTEFIDENIVWFVCGTLLLASVFNCFLRKRIFNVFSFMMIFTVIGCVSFQYANTLEYTRLNEFIDERYNISVRVVEPGVYHKEDNRSEFVCEIISASKNGHTTYISLDEKCQVFADGRVSCKYNDILKISYAMITHARGEQNTGDFNYARYLKGKGITVIINTEDYNIHFDGKYTGGNPVYNKIQMLKAWIIDAIDSCIPEREAGVMKAIFAGDKRYIDAVVKSSFATSGISHIISVSGLHLTILSNFIAMLLNALFIRDKRIKNLIMIVTTFMLMLLMGFTPSVLRSGTMLIISSLAYFADRESDSLNSMCIAAFLIFLINPVSAYDLGFLLSFASTLGIVLIYPYFYNKFNLSRKSFVNTLAAAILTTVSSQLIALPISVLYTDSLSTMFIITNLLVVPFMPAVLLSGILFLIEAAIGVFVRPFLSGLIFLLTYGIIELIMWFANLEYSSILLSGKIFFKVYITTFVSAIAVGYIVNFKECSMKKKFISSLIVLIVAVVSFITSYTPSLPGEARVTFLNVGQGDCALIQTSNGTSIMIDGGGTSVEDYSVGDEVVIPYLISNNIRKIDYAIITHFHDDHAEGIITLMKNYQVDNLIVPDVIVEDNDIKNSAYKIANKKAINIKEVSDGDKLEIDNVILDILSPVKDFDGDLNNTSIMLKAQCAGASFMFTGDAEKAAEKRLLGRNLKCDVLKVGHHGSTTSSTDEFVKAVSPEYAVISVGEDNVYGHPAGKTIYTLLKYDVEYMRTDLNGTIVFDVDKDGIKEIRTLKGDIYGET